MGQQNSYQAGLNSSLTLLQQLPIGKVFKDTQSETLYFIKQYAYTSQQAFQQAFLKFSSKLTTKNDNVLNLQKTNTKVDNTFCSTFYKIVLVFEYVNYSLADQIAVRNKENRAFQEKEIWSLLFHCTLGISHLKRTEGIEHSAIGLNDIKLSQDGTIKIMPTQMVGIYSQHDQNYGTTKKLAMTILSCILTKQISNQSTEYLQALIQKTKCSKQLKKVLYIMIMDDTTFQELEEYLFKLANDQNDTLLSGVSTPAYSAHKRTSIQESNLKKTCQDNIQSQIKGQIFSLAQEKEDSASVIPQFETFEFQNPDEKDEKDDVNDHEASIEEQEQESSIHPHNETQTFSNQGNIHIDYKMKENVINSSSISDVHEDATVRLKVRRESNAPIFTNLPNVELPVVRSQNLYTDPKLLDLIKKDLEEIQQKSRVSFGKKNVQSANLRQMNQQQQVRAQFQSSSSFKRSSFYNISGGDFNIKPVAIQSQSIKPIQIKQSFRAQNSSGVKETEKKLQQSFSKQTFKDIENIPKRLKEQESFGNILDEDASFKKANAKKSTTVTARQPQLNRGLQKENIFESSETKRTVQQSFQKSQKTITAPKITETKLTSQSLQQQSPSIQFVSQTYQKGEYKGYKLNGLRHGNGTFYYKEGGKYIGEWKQNKMNGKGTLYYPNDQIAYDGNWKDDQLHGYGTLYNEEVLVLEKSFDYQDWDMVEEYWVKYQGEFCMDNKNGKGKLFLSNGEIFEGHFKEDMIEGEGVLTRQNGTRVRGLWRKNHLLRMY